MFERYDNRARRVIFFARYEASRERDTTIRCVHLLAGLQREVSRLLQQAGLNDDLLEQIRRSLARHSDTGRVPIPADADMPLDPFAREALNHAARAAEKFASELVIPVHLLWGIFHADAELRKQLEQAGLTKSKLEAITKEDSAASHAALFHQNSEEDFSIAMSRSGIGYDLHRMAERRKLILGGVEVPFDHGPVGHSDGDVLSHAICDALLGAAGLGDIGTHFPDTDPKWKGVSSLVFLEQTRSLLEGRGLRIAHIDAVVITERPKLGPHFAAMRAALGKALGIESHQINLKAKTNEGIGELGRGEAIAAHAIATLET